MSIEAIKEALASMCLAASMHDSEWTHRMGEVNDWGTQCWEIDGERVQELATAYGETTAALIAACNPQAIRSLIERLEAAEAENAQLLAGIAKCRDLIPTPKHLDAEWIAAMGHPLDALAYIAAAMESGGLAEGVSDGRGS